jgi:hypothetical protein
MPLIRFLLSGAEQQGHWSIALRLVQLSPQLGQLGADDIVGGGTLAPSRCNDASLSTYQA